MQKVIDYLTSETMLDNLESTQAGLLLTIALSGTSLVLVTLMLKIVSPEELIDALGDSLSD